ncbi:MAG: 16S rRNA (uracil(1498)-N(3))-methyltransferase [Pseudomonadota bacterium]
MIPRIYTPVDLAVDDTITLEKSASAHIAKVLRMSCGDSLIIFNGDGYNYAAEIVQAGKFVNVCVKEQQANTTESPLRITLVQGVSRSDRMDYALQKSVELGIVEFAPVFTEKSSVKLDATRADKKVKHWQSVAISAAEQSGRSRIVDVKAPVTLTQWLADSDYPEKIIALEPTAEKTLRDCAVDKECVLLVGPESGFSANEIAQIRDHKITAAKLGPRVLRTETAAVAAITALQTLYGDLSLD